MRREQITCANCGAVIAVESFFELWLLKNGKIACSLKCKEELERRTK